MVISLFLIKFIQKEGYCKYVKTSSNVFK